MRTALVSAAILVVALQQSALAGPTTRDAAPSCTGFLDCLAKPFNARPIERPQAARSVQDRPALDHDANIARAFPLLLGIGY